MIKPKANEEAIKQIPAPASLFAKIELIAKTTPIHPVMKALMAAEIFILNNLELLCFSKKSLFIIYYVTIFILFQSICL
jgi:hypothetical protein